MENVVAARRLRKSVLNSVGEVDLNLYNINKARTTNTEKTHRNLSVKKDESLVLNFKTKFILKIFICSLILFTIILSKMFFLEEIKSNHTIVRLYDHYNMHFSREKILGKVEYRIGKIDSIIGNIVPNEVRTFVVEKYNTSFKGYILTFNLKEFLSNMINLESKKEITVDAISMQSATTESIYANVKEKEETLNGMGGAEPLQEKKEEVTSSISIMDKDIKEIKNKNINIILPVNGVVTSRYGVRDEVFSGVDPYHTGIDIANKSGTEILSATKGVVSKVEYNNKYYGNFVEITENEVTFKYAHLNSISVKKGSSINQKEKVGLMGSTGMSTGPHLHFEIRINNRTVNPEELLKF